MMPGHDAAGTRPAAHGLHFADLPRSRVAVLYATREGQSRRVAERVADKLRSGGATVDVDDVAYAPSDVSLLRYAALILVTSVFMGRHERAMVEFVKDHRRDLVEARSALLTVSQEGAQTVGATTQDGARDDDPRATIESFCVETRWRPERIQPVAGELRDSEYAFAVRFETRSIAAGSIAGGSMTTGSMATETDDAIDTARDVEYTDWDSLDRFVEDVADSFGIPVTDTARSATAAFPDDGG